MTKMYIKLGVKARERVVEGDLGTLYEVYLGLIQRYPEGARFAFDGPVPKWLNGAFGYARKSNAQ
jgi:hypothetical protein